MLQWCWVSKPRTELPLGLEKSNTGTLDEVRKVGQLMSAMLGNNSMIRLLFRFQIFPVTSEFLFRLNKVWLKGSSECQWDYEASFYCYITNLALMKNNIWLSLTTGEKSQTMNRTRNEDSEGPRKFFWLGSKALQKRRDCLKCLFFWKVVPRKKIRKRKKQTKSFWRKKTEFGVDENSLDKKSAGV